MSNPKSKIVWQCFLCWSWRPVVILTSFSHPTWFFNRRTGGMAAVGSWLLQQSSLSWRRSSSITVLTEEEEEEGSGAEGGEILGASGTTVVAMATEEDTNAVSVKLLIIELGTCGLGLTWANSGFYQVVSQWLTDVWQVEDLHHKMQVELNCFYINYTEYCFPSLKLRWTSYYLRN